jgi:Domain of unknown function (DUF4259)
MTGFDDPELLRDALEEVAEATPGSYVEEPWGSSALAAAEEVAQHGTDPELRDLGDDEARIEDALARLSEAAP